MSTINVNNVMPVTGDTVNINGVIMMNGVLSATTYQNIPSATFTGGTIDGFTEFTNSLSATTISATTFYGDGSNLTGIGTGLIEVTKAELDVLISASGLTAGATYKISGVDVNLYSGTTIFLQALTPNQLKTNGSGIFYNPKYDVDSVWSNKVSFYMENKPQYAEFGIYELVVSDTDAYGYLETYGMVRWLSGDWTSATTFTGTSTLHVAEFSNVVSPNYGLNDTVIWGGKKWVNVSGDTIVITDEVLATGNGFDNSYGLNLENRPVNIGSFTLTDGVETFTADTSGLMTGDMGGSGSINYLDGNISVNFNSAVISGAAITASYISTGIGNSIDEYTLNSIWSEIPFNETDYNVVLDEIEYDIVHDIIIARKDRFNNQVECNYQSILELTYGFNLGNPIKDFQWGNGNDNWGYGGGLYTFSDKIDSNNGISDGGDDMYDGANEIYTDLGNVPYTHTRLTIEPDGGVLPSLFPKDGVVVSGDTYFGTGSEYFTNLYPGLFVMHADNILINDFTIDGNIGADEDGDYEVDRYILTGFSTNYTVFVKKVYNSDDPSINHIMIVDTDDMNIIHEYDTTNEDDFDKISSLSAATKIHFLVTSTFPGSGYITKEKIDEIVTTYMALVDGRPTISDVLTALNDNYETITSLLPPPQSTNYTGVMGNYVKDSYLGCLNFNGGYIWNNNLTQHSYISNNDLASSIFDGGCAISDNDLTGNSYIIGNRLSNSSTIVNNNLNHGSFIGYNLMDKNSDIESNDFNHSAYMTYNRFYNNSDIRKNSLSENSYLYQNIMDELGFYDNILQISGQFSDNKGYNLNFQNNVVGNSSVNNNYFTGTTVSNNDLLKNSQINSNEFSNAQIITNDLFYGIIDSNILNGFNLSINYNVLNNSQIRANTLTGNGSRIDQNNLSNSSQIESNFVIGNSSISFNTLSCQSQLSDNNLTNQGYIHFNTLGSSSVIINGTFDLNARVEYCKLSNNSVFNLADTPNITQTIRYIDANRGSLSGDLTSATNIYSIGGKTLMTNASDVSALIFIDGSNVQQIVAINS
jgi:hypothetical protein